MSFILRRQFFVRLAVFAFLINLFESMCAFSNASEKKGLFANNEDLQLSEEHSSQYRNTLGDHNSKFIEYKTAKEIQQDLIVKLWSGPTILISFSSNSLFFTGGKPALRKIIPKMKNGECLTIPRSKSNFNKLKLY